MNSLCGVRLSTVGVVIGWIGLVASTFSTILLCVGLSRLDELVKYIVDNINDPNSETEIRTAVIIASCVYLTISLANVISSALLILGTVKERHLLLTPWLINGWVAIFFNSLNFVYLVYVSIAKGLPIGSVLGVLISTGLGLAIQCIIWNAIYSLFKQIRANRDQQQQLLYPTTSLYPNYTELPGSVK